MIVYSVVFEIKGKKIGKSLEVRTFVNHAEAQAEMDKLKALSKMDQTGHTAKYYAPKLVIGTLK